MGEIEKWSDEHPQGCLVGNYKPFNKTKKVLARKRAPGNVCFFKYVLTLKMQQQQIL